MPSPNLYADLNAFRGLFVDNQTLDATDQTAVLRAIEAGSRRVDNMTHRTFFAETDTRVFDGNGRSWMWLPDLLAATTIKLDEDANRTFELTLAAATDYYLKRRFYRNEDALPKTALELDQNGQRTSFLKQKRLVEIVGRWGFTEITEVVDSIPSAGQSSTSTTLPVVDGTLFSVGQTVLIELEQEYIRAISGNNLTVYRAVNGTTAVEHVFGKLVNRFVYPPEIIQATLILAGRLIKRRERDYANVSDNLVSGLSQKFFRYDPDVGGLLEEYTRGDAMI